MAKKKTKAKTAHSKSGVRVTTTRQVKTPEPKWWQINKRVKHPVSLPSAWNLCKTSAKILAQHKKLFIGITLVYGMLNLILVQGLSSNTDITNLKTTLDHVFTGHFAGFGSSVGTYILLLGSGGNSSSQTAGAYQLFLGLITSLAVIWALRQVFAGTIPRIRDCYYRGMYPLVPFLLVMLVIGLQLIPLLIGSTLYAIVINQGVAVNVTEKLLFGLLFIGFSLWTFYMLSSSIFALYVVALPDMAPMKALRNARQLVKNRRWTVLRKVLVLPIVLVLASSLVMVPVIVWLTPLAKWVFFLLTMFALVAAQTYMYNLYRELLNE